ncbi:MAG: hypothetical protein R3C15_00345 [Thermoleophilia bacterium]
MQIVAIDPPEQGFYAKRLDVPGVAIKAHACVRDEALLQAGRLAVGLLARAPAIVANLAAVGAELHVLGERQRVTDLPMYRHMAGVAFDGGRTMDERARGYGGLHACCAEEALLRLPTARHRDHRDVTSHELAHTVLSYGLDERVRGLVESRYAEARPRWRRAYAATNAQEFFAELTMWYVGSRGDYTSLPSPAPGPRWLARFDPESYDLLDAIYGGRIAPALIEWTRLEPSTATRSEPGGAPVSLLLVNRTDRVVERFWLGFRGERKGYGPVQPGTAVGQSTYAGHPWLLVDDDGNELGTYVSHGAVHGLVVLERT